MAVKNQKKNKSHIKELRRDPDNWVNVIRERNERIKIENELKEFDLSDEQATKIAERRTK